MLLYYFLFLIFTLGSSESQVQQAFHANPSTATLQLKSIYHHASSRGPIPGLFRRLDVDQAHSFDKTPSSSLDIKPLLGHYERITQHAKNYLVLHADQHLSSQSYQPKKIRWGHLTSLTPFNNDLLKESAYDLVPDVAHRQTILSLAIMTNNAYSGVDNTTDWYDLGQPWKLNTSFGWESDGVRGHIFGNDDNSLFVISYKGTSVGVIKDEPTGPKDKVNDNMLFSCCCARISRVWTPVCDCYQGNEYVCKTDCLEQAILNTEFYYDHAMAIYLDLADRYPYASIWLTGHSLGGSLASLVGQTFGVPAISFQAPGEFLASRRLHLPYYKNMPLWHFGHTADPIFVGACTGPSSICWYGGMAMESRCHTGKMCVWDTINDYGWRLDARTHRIKDVIDNILNKTEEEFPLPRCEKEQDCADCGLWQFIDSRDGNSTTTSSSASSTATSTQIATEPPDDPWYQ